LLLRGVFLKLGKAVAVLAAGLAEPLLALLPLSCCWELNLLV
jgi:hypothetical protein